MTFCFDTPIDRRQSDSIKWRHYEVGTLPMWVADMDFSAPVQVIQALQERVAHGIFGYPQEPAILRELIVSRMKEKYRWEITPEMITFMPGVVVAFNLACHTFGQPQGEVLIQPPVYPPILSAAEQTHLVSKQNELVKQTDGSYVIDFDAFESALSTDTRLFLLCNPHNPVGRVFRPDELTRMAEICLRHNVPICSDEIHCDLVFSGHPHTPIAALSPEIAAQTITLMSPSKTFNIAGLECAYAIIPDPEIRERYQKAKQGLVSGVNLMGWVAATAAYQHGEPWLAELMVYLQANRDFLVDFVRREIPTIQVAPPEGSYLAWLNCGAAGIGNRPSKYFLQNGHVAFNEGISFGKSGRGHVRLNFGCTRATLTEALNRLKESLP